MPKRKRLKSWRPMSPADFLLEAGDEEGLAALAIQEVKAYRQEKRDTARALYDARMGAERLAYWEREPWGRPQKDGTRRIGARYRMRSRRLRYARWKAWFAKYEATHPRRVYRLEDLIARVPEQLRRLEEFKQRVDPDLWVQTFSPSAWKGAGLYLWRQRNGRGTRRR